MRIFVTGGTGYIGSAIVEALVRAGHEVTGLARSDEKEAVLARLGAKAARGALGGLGKLRDTLAAQDAVVHTAVDYTIGPPGDQEAIDAMLGAGRAAQRPFSVVYTSGVWVLGPTQTAAAAEAPATEASSPDRPAAAVAWRPAHERAVLEAATPELATAVIRPGIVFGEGRGLVSPWFEEAVNTGTVSFVGSGAQRWPFVHRSDLAELYRLVVERRARGIFHGVDGASPTVSEAASAASRAAGKGGAVSAIPLEEARKAMGPMADALAMDQVVISTRGVEIGWTPKHPPFMQDAPNAFREWRAYHRK